MSYEMIDRFLRNNLGDDDYEEYSQALDAICSPPSKVDSEYLTIPVEYQYHYPDGSWHCSNGESVNGMRPDRARSLYALKDSQ